MSEPLWLQRMQAWEPFAQLKASILRQRGFVSVTGLSEHQKSHFTAALTTPRSEPCLFITHNIAQARALAEDFRFFSPKDCFYFPAREIVLYNAAAHSHDDSAQRLAALTALALGRPAMIIAPVEALLQPLPSPELFCTWTVTLKTGDMLAPLDLAGKASALGYERVGAVEGMGQFSLRGGILDIYPLTEPLPWRIEFFDEEVDSIRAFDPVTQRSTEPVQTCTIPPTRELLLTPETLRSGQKAIEKSASRLLNKMESVSDFNRDRLQSKIGRLLEEIQNGIQSDALYNYYPFFCPEPSLLLDYLPETGLIALDEPLRLREQGLFSLEEFHARCKELLLAGEVLPEQTRLLSPFQELIRKAAPYRGLLLQALPKASALIEPRMAAAVTGRTIPSYQGRLELLAEDLRYWKGRGFFCLLLTGSVLRAKSLADHLREHGIEGHIAKDGILEALPGQVVLMPGSLSKGFEYTDARFVLVSDQEIYGVHKKKLPVSRRGKKLDPFTDLKPGGYVVHENHGIGRYLRIEKLTVDGRHKDYLHVQYAGTDKLYIPTDQMDLIQPYIGMDDKAPKLSKLGGSEWQKAKMKVRASVKELAEDLLKLYAAREAAAGHVYASDSDWQRQFEDLFPYEETPDQLQSTLEIKRDMESKKVMDRLLCGDVGYGKTEVAVRAAFKAVMDGKQAAVLAPTTILAQQHYNTFVSRFGSFPFTAQVISRFKTHKEQTEILQGLKEGSIDVIIGTHRLLGKDVKFKDLGLLIVDEEQRFGVSHKETIKGLKKNIDVLTLTATPIPRTLHMSLIGIRDISVIETPPEERYPVQTLVVEYNETLVREAVLREIGRGGQVYVVYNQVKSMERVAERLRTLLPDVRIAIAHGQMGEGALERVMIQFYEREVDLLLCSTIIESGLDIPNVNTLIVHDADHFGLSQLYQLRGRVGRSNRLAYAYFTYRRDKILSEVAEKRLMAIKEFTEFGSGFKIAMRDLEIRGAGNLLGAEQHGHMSSVGYDLYCKLLHETVQSLKGEPLPKPLELMLDLKADAFIDPCYIPRESDRINLYKRIAAIENLQDRYDVEEELEDRFGEMPQSVQNLVRISHIRALALAYGFSEISRRSGEVKMRLADGRALHPKAFMILLNENRGRLKLAATQPPVFVLALSKGPEEKGISETLDMLMKIKDLQEAQ